MAATDDPGSALSGQVSASAAASVYAAADRFANRVSHWSQARWTPQRAEVVYNLVQRLADLGADAEHRAHRTVPRLDNDLALPDQVRVMVIDIATAKPPASVDLLAQAADAIDTTTRTL